MSFEELMAQANKLQKKKSDPISKTSSSSTISKKDERSTVSGKRPPASASSSHTQRNSNNNNNNDNNNNTPSIYRNRRPTMPKSTPDSSRPMPASHLSARDKVRQMMRQPPQKLNTQKRDLRSISEIQRDIRHKKGIYSDEEDDIRSDPRLLQNKRVVSSEHRYNKMSPGPAPSSTSRASFPAGKRPAGSAAAMMSRNRNIGESRRMPFSRPPPERRRPMQRYEQEEELDEEMDDFVVNDEEEEEELNDYSAEIGRIFRYNKKR